MFNLISANGAGPPLVGYETILGHIHRTRSSQGFPRRAGLDQTDYPTGYK